MTTLVFFVEEPSAREFFISFLPRIIPSENYDFQFVVFEGKSDLEKRMTLRLRSWAKPDCRFIIMRDQDSENCREVKRRLVKKCADGNKEDALVRIACSEIESWYLGDLTAVEKAYSINGLGKKQKKDKYRDPDRISNSAEELIKITNKRYQKVAGSREIGKYLSVDQNRSHSFQVFVNGLLRLLA
jgi:hypothetical protein